MANKPSVVAVWEKSKTIYDIKNLCDTMNWMTGYLANLSAEPGLKIKNEKTDHPSIALDLSAVLSGTGGIEVKEEAGKTIISGGGGSLTITDTNGH